MSNEKLGTFKVGDAYKVPVDSPKKRSKEDQQQQPSGEAYSLGFTRIEGILEKEEPAAINASLTKLRNDLEVFHDGSTANKDKAAASKALTAVERTVDLLSYLFQTKEALQSQAQAKPK